MIFDAMDRKDNNFLMVIEPDIIKHLKKYEKMLKEEIEEESK